MKVINNSIFPSCYYCSCRRYGFSRQAGKTEQVKTPNFKYSNCGKNCIVEVLVAVKS